MSMPRCVPAHLAATAPVMKHSANGFRQFWLPLPVEQRVGEGQNIVQPGRTTE